MQTFMTQMSYGRTAADLDDNTLYQQMQECMDIFDILTGVTTDYKDHPVHGMWEGYEYALGIYAMFLNLEWTFQRGFADHEAARFFYTNIKEMQKSDAEFVYEMPPWMKDKAVIKSHRSNLVRRRKLQYKDQWKVAPDNWPVLWPKIDFNSSAGYKLYVSKVEKEMMKESLRAVPPADVMDRVVNW